jgi:hypothetical protein
MDRDVDPWGGVDSFVGWAILFTMIHADHDVFIAAIHSKNLIQLVFYSQQDGDDVTRICVPFDYAPRRPSTDKTPHYQVLDYSPSGPHNLAKLASEIRSIRVLEDTFELNKKLIHWDVSENPWTVPRDWGEYSS